ncbi:MAG: heat-inducible transcriptional repressor HrcA [Bacteroidota bacterium]
MPDSRRSIPLRPTAPALSEREQSILRLVVQRFVQTAAPVGSRVISEEDEIVLSSASIRNTMSRLEALGYLGHPHTSAGRVPTELGYRFYVDSLMNVAGLTPGDEAILRQSLDALYGDIEALTRTSSRLLGQLSQLLGVVLTPKLATGTLDRIDVVPLSSSRVMFVLEVRGGLVRTIIAEADAEIQRSDLPRLVTLLNERLAGLSLGEIRKTGAARLDDLLGDPSTPDPAGLVRLVVREADTLFREPPNRRAQVGSPHHLVAQPEFQDPEVVRGLIRMVEDGEAVVHLLEADPVEPGDEDASAIVLIGRELTTDLTGDAIAAPDYAVVTAPYRVGDTIGRVGVIGPTRMDYGRAVALVERVASLLSRSAA